MRPALSVIVATRDRGALLATMLHSLDGAVAQSKQPVETIVVDNGSSDRTPQLLEDWARQGPNRIHLTVGERGKSRALNAALKAATAALLVFTDDDVEIPADWLNQITAFFDSHPSYAAAMGCVRTPPQVTDPTLLAKVDFYRTLPLYDQGEVAKDIKHLYGCNMAIRRPILDQVGEFNEQLGPGASGLHEDGDMARRIREHGLRIGYMPRAIVYHTVEADRLTFEFFREMHRRDARSRFVLDPHRSLSNAFSHWLGSAAGVALWTLLLNRRRRMKALARLVSHSEMLRLVRQHKG